MCNTACRFLTTVFYSRCSFGVPSLIYTNFVSTFWRVSVIELLRFATWSFSPPFLCQTRTTFRNPQITSFSHHLTTSNPSNSYKIHHVWRRHNTWFLLPKTHPFPALRPGTGGVSTAVPRHGPHGSPAHRAPTRFEDLWAEPNWHSSHRSSSRSCRSPDFFNVRDSDLLLVFKWIFVLFGDCKLGW